MIKLKRDWRIECLIAAVALSAAGAQAQSETAEGNFISFVMKRKGPISLGIVLLALIILAVLLLLSRRGRAPLEDVYSEPEVESSKFEQLLAEIQGLYLRVQGGESKGCYRKIEQLARVFLERTGHPDARQMSEEEIQSILSGGSIGRAQADALASIFERCRQGADHEGRKPDVTPGELLKDLRGLVKQVEDTPSHPHPSL